VVIEPFENLPGQRFTCKRLRNEVHARVEMPVVNDGTGRSAGHEQNLQVGAKAQALLGESAKAAVSRRRRSSSGEAGSPTNAMRTLLPPISQRITG
jgi:hypothetical protein